MRGTLQQLSAADIRSRFLQLFFSEGRGEKSPDRATNLLIGNPIGIPVGNPLEEGKDTSRILQKISAADIRSSFLLEGEGKNPLAGILIGFLIGFPIGFPTYLPQSLHRPIGGMESFL